MEQVFTPTKVQAYHQVHPIERPWPHKRTRGASVKFISFCFPCQTLLPLQARRLLSLPVPLLPWLQKPMKTPPNPRLPQRYLLKLRLRKTMTCPSNPLTPEPVPFALSPPFRPYQFLEPTWQGKHKNKSKRSPNKLLPPSKGENTSSGPASNNSEKGMSGRGQTSIGSEKRCTSELTELPPVHRALFLTVSASSTFESPLGGNLPKLATSVNPPETPQLLKEQWGGPAMTSTIMSSMLAHTHPPGMSTLPQRVRYLVGSKPCSTRLILDFEPSSPEPKTSMTEGSQPTFSDIAAWPSESVPSRTCERTLKRGWQKLVKTSTSSPSTSAVLAVQSDWPLFSTSRVFPMARSQTRGPLHTNEGGTSDDDEGKVKDNLPSKRRVMSSTPSGYAFCQYLSPKMGHDGRLCDCMTEVGLRG